MFVASVRRKFGFNLIEIAIVLAVVGLVIGGIYVAAGAVRDQMRISGIAKDIYFMTSKARQILPRSSFPASGFTDITATAVSTGIFPAGYAMIGSFAIAPNGVKYRMQTSCNSGVCPAIMLQIPLQNGTATYEASPNESECAEIFRRVLSDKDLMRFYATNSGGMSGTTYQPTVDPLSISCAGAAYMDLRYRY